MDPESKRANNKCQITILIDMYIAICELYIDYSNETADSKLLMIWLISIYNDETICWLFYFINVEHVNLQ